MISRKDVLKNKEKNWIRDDCDDGRQIIKEIEEHLVEEEEGWNRR